MLFRSKFIQNIVDFLIIAVSIFIVIKALNATKKKVERAAVVTAEAVADPQIALLEDIRNLLRKK